MCTIDSECVRFGKAALTLQKVDIKQSYNPYFYHYFLEKEIWKISITKIWNGYRESLQFADFGGNENPRIAKPRISRTPAFGYRCLLKLYQILFTILIGNCLPISIQKVAII